MKSRTRFSKSQHQSDPAGAPSRLDWYPLLRTALFGLDPEQAHELSLRGLRLGHHLGLTRRCRQHRQQPVQCMGLEFPNPVGVAAGLDKNADYFEVLGDLGFGFVEVGTVTPRPQPGNPRPRIFRIPHARAMINRLGFNNKGVDYLVERVRKRRFTGVLGINIGKNFDTPLDRAGDDYAHCLQKVYASADYVAVNISSPNTRDLRDLQSEKALDRLLERLCSERLKLAEQHQRFVPLALKIAPDLTSREISTIAQRVRAHGIEAILATNTSIDHSAIAGLEHGDETGGLSGAPLKSRADQVLAELAAQLTPSTTLIGVGGICSGQDAVDKIQLGASLVQCYTGLVYRGPGLLAECLEAIARQRAA